MNTTNSIDAFMDWLRVRGWRIVADDGVEIVSTVEIAGWFAMAIEAGRAAERQRYSLPDAPSNSIAAMEQTKAYLFNARVDLAADTPRVSAALATINVAFDLVNATLDDRPSCPDCGGSGYISAHSFPPCKRCNGSGKIDPATGIFAGEGGD